MKIFEKLFNNNKFPKECNDGTIKIVVNKIICEGNHGINSCEVNIGDIQYAYVIVNVNRQSFLFLFDSHQNSIPTIYNGFKNVYKELSKRLKFNDAVFFDNVNKKVELKKEISRRQYEPTYEILNENIDDYDKGFEILSPQRQFISWDTTYEELKRNEDVIFEESPYGQKISKFKYPIRIGNLKLKDFGSYIDNGRTDVPVLHFYTQCFDRFGTDRSYDDLKRTLIKDIGLDEKRHSHERTDHKNIYFDLNGMSLSISYTYDSDWWFNCGYTSLSIENKREYNSYLVDQDYESKIIISDFLILDGKIGISEDYKRNKRIKRRQQKITDQFKNKTVIWTDHVNNKIGFSSGQFSQVYDIKELKSFCIQNILPAKGSGGSYLELILENRKYNYAIFAEQCHFFDKYAESVMQLTNKGLSFGQEYHDC
jgi:hypothetical protein